MYDPVATEQLTTRDMVTHRSGLARHDLVWYSSSFSREDLVSRLRYLEPNKPLREKFQYKEGGRPAPSYPARLPLAAEEDRHGEHRHHQFGQRNRDEHSAHT